MNPCQKSQSPRSLPLALAIVTLLANGQALAWPFVSHNWLGTTGTEDRIRVFHADNDRQPEFSRGSLILHREGASSSQSVLPTPDPDPYTTSDPNVIFRNHRLATGDIDGDGDTDLVESSGVYYGNGTSTQDFRMMALLNDGQGNYSRGWQWKGAGSDRDEPEVHLTDLDHDGDLDLVEGFDSVRVRWNPGNGNFGGTTTVLDSINFKGARTDFVSGDFNRDGLMDLVAFGVHKAANADGFDLFGRSVLYAGKAGGGFTVAILATLPNSDSYQQAEVEDLDRDGRPDLVFTRFANPSSVAWMRNNGNGFDATATLIFLPNSAHTRFGLGDLDEDGRTDIVFASNYQKMEWARSTGAATFAPVQTLATNSDSRASPGALVVTDVDGDGDSDILYNSGEKLLENTAIHPFTGITRQVWTWTNPGAGTVDLHTGRITGGARPDLLATDPAGQRILIYPAGNTTLMAPLLLSTAGDDPTCVAAGDFDGDGRDDVAWTTGSAVKWARNINGTGIGWSNSTALTLAGVNQIVAADADVDGDVDLLVSTPTSTSVRWLMNNGSGTAWSSQMVAVSVPGVQRLAVGQTIPGGRPEVELIFTASDGISAWHRYEYVAGNWTLVVSLNQPGATPSATSKGLAMGRFQEDAWAPATAFKSGSSGNSIQIRPNQESVYTPYAVRNLAAVDWNRDGLEDLLAAQAGNVAVISHFPGSTGQWQTYVETGSNNVPTADAVPFDLDRNGRMDAVSVEQDTGKLYLHYNSSAETEATLTSPVASGTSLKLLPGTQGTTVNLTVRNSGHGAPPPGRSPDAAAVPESCEFVFRRAVSNGPGGYLPGTPLTEAEINAVVKTVRFANASAIPSGTSNGRFTLTLNSFVQAAQAVNAGATRSFALGLELESTALSAPVTRFFVDIAGGVASPVRWFPQSLSGSVGPVPLETTRSGLASVLVEVTAPSLLQQWRMSHFSTYDSTGSAANDADPDKDGVPNLVEYVTGRNPKTSTPQEMALPVLSMTVQEHPLPALAQTVLINGYDPAVRVSVEISQNLTQWGQLASRHPDGSWSGSAPFAFPFSGGRTSFIFNTTFLPANSPGAFVRLKVDERP